MYPIPAKGTEKRQRMIAEHRACTNYMKGVPGCSILRTERPGSTINPYGGIHEYMDLAKVLVRMRAMQPNAYGGKYVVMESVHWLPRGIFTPDSGTGRLLLALSRDVSSAPLVGELTPDADRAAALLAAVPDRHQPQQGPDRKEAACPR